MKLFDKLTREEYTTIVNERINAILEISNELLEKFIPIDSLRSYYTEYPPVLGGKSHLKSCLLGTGGDKLGTLQRFYLMTYIVDGSIKFRSKNENTSEIWVVFDRNLNSGQLNNEKPKFTIDGNNRLRGTNLIKIVSSNEVHFPLAPSLNIKIDIDGKTVFNRSIATLISSLQPNTQVALLNSHFFDFKELTIEILNHNPDLRFECNIVFI